MTIDTCKFSGQRVIVRVDFNVPLDENGNITDDTRIRGALPTLKKIHEDGGKLIIMSHMGRPKKNPDPKFSLRQIVGRVSELLGAKVDFCDDCQKAKPQVDAMKDGDVLLLENLRFYEEETGKPRGEFANDDEKAAAKKALKPRQQEFTKTLASYADIYVNDAFGTAHRKHASTAIIADYFDADHKMFGYLMEKEINAVNKVLNDIQRPFVAIMGGSKVSSKIEIIENLLTKVDTLILGGGMTYTFMKAKGGKIGKSIVENDFLDLANNLVKEAEEKGVKLLLAEDSKAGDDFSNDCNTQICPSDNITAGSRAIADAIVEATANGAYSLIGGGDSVACINKFGMADKVSYVSTGGGALLEAIEGKTLPGIAAITGDK